MKNIKILKNRILNAQKWLYIIILLFACVLPLIQNKFILDIIFNLVLFAILSESWNLLTGYSGPVSLGHVVYFGVGAYSSSILYVSFGVNPWIGLIIGAFITAVFAGVMGIFLFRLKTHFFALSTVALLLIMHILAGYYSDFTGGHMGLLLPINAGAKDMVFISKVPYIYIGLIILIILCTFMYSLNTSKFGYSLIAVRENEDAAKAMGLHPIFVWVKANMISAFFMSLGGSLYAQYMCYIDPESVFGMNVSVKIALYSIIGGVGTVIGPILGTTIMVPTEILFRTSFGRSVTGLNMAIYGVFLIIFVIYAKDGLMSIITRYKERWEKRRIKEISSEREMTFTSNISNVVGGVVKGDKLPFAIAKDKSRIVLEIKNITKNFGGLTAVKDFSFSLKTGEVIGLIGPNGAGKTTTFNMITGFIPQTSGSIIANGNEYKRAYPWILCKAGVARTFQLVKPFKKLTLMQNVMIGAYAKTNDYKEAKNIAVAVIDFVGMRHQMNYPTSKLTVCDLKKLELAKALATKPIVILLDEVMSGLTPTESKEMCDLIKKIADQNIGLVIVEHVMQVISTCCERVLVLNFGELIAEGTYKEITENDQVIKAYLGGSRRYA